MMRIHCQIQEMMVPDGQEENLMIQNLSRERVQNGNYICDPIRISFYSPVFGLSVIQNHDLLNFLINSYFIV